MPKNKKNAPARMDGAQVEATNPSDAVYENNKNLIDKLLHSCCSHLNGQPMAIADEVIARFPAYCEEHRVTMADRSKAKKGKRKPGKPKTPSGGWSVTGGQ